MCCLSTLLNILENHRNKYDRRKFGLVIQGGGMRTAYAVGAITSLIRHDLADTFQHVVGSSAGAVSVAAVVRQVQDPTGFIYDVANKNFVNMLRSDKKVDIDYAIDVALKLKNPLNIQNL